MNTDNVFNELVKIQSWPNVALVFALVIVVGYCFRFWKNFPNEAIPAIVILTGAVGMMLLADVCPANIRPRIWHAKNAIIGLIIGFIAWMAHNLVVSRIEDWLASKSTVFFKLMSAKTPAPVVPPTTTTNPVPQDPAKPTD